ncbi:histidine kinase [Caballeronia peredens]|nr:histidine kinase [Caballeronia peredens]
MFKSLLPRTLRTRLTVLIILSTSAVLALSGVALYEALRNRIESSASEEMTGTLSALQSHLADLQKTSDVPHNWEMWVDQLHGHQNMDLAMYDMAGERLFSTSRFQAYAPIQSADPGHSPLSLARDESKLKYLVTMASLNGTDGPRVRVAVQYDRSGDVALLRAHAYTIVVIQVLGVGLASALAYGIAFLGLSPLRRLSKRAEQMSSSRLAQPFAELDASGELKELEHAFNGMLHRLNESFTRLNQFSSNLAHDMRTPLTNLQAAAQVALSRPRNAADYRDVLEASIGEYQRLTRMIEDMLFLARAESTDLSIEAVRLDAAFEAERVANYYESMAEDAGVEIVVKGRADVFADLLLYQRVLSNLLTNALKFAPRGTEIRVDCSESSDATVIAVSDTGVGIDSEHIDRIFERFYRVDPSRHNSASGTGLGLAIVKSIMESHRGRCWVESKPGVRTTFSLSFPKQVAASILDDSGKRR